MHTYKQQPLTFKKSLLIGLSALSLAACGGGGSSTENTSNTGTSTGGGGGSTENTSNTGAGGGDTDSKKTFNLSVIIDCPIQTNGLMLKNTATGADNTPFAIAKTVATTLNLEGKIAKGSDYNIEVVHQPEGFAQFCYVEQGTGTLASTDIAIHLKCVEGAAKVSTYAGASSSSGKTNGKRQDARFNSPRHMVFDSKGNLFIAEFSNNQIRKITPEGTVSLFAGDKNGARGKDDGTGSAASFNRPISIVVDEDDNLYVGSSNNSCVRKITPQAVVTTLAGKCGTQGDVPVKTSLTNNSTGADARFSSIGCIVYDGHSALYVFDTYNQRIRKIILNEGTAATVRVQNIIAIGGVSMGLSADKKRLYYISTPDYKLYELDLTRKTKKPLTTKVGSGFKDGGFSVAQFNSSDNQLIASKSGQFLYLADYKNNRVRRIDLTNKTVSTLAGSGNNGVTDGIGEDAIFRYPRGIAQDAQGNLFVSSPDGEVIRKLKVVKKP